jgi:hypothetical protein
VTTAPPTLRESLVDELRARVAWLDFLMARRAYHKLAAAAAPAQDLLAALVRTDEQLDAYLRAVGVELDDEGEG